MIACRDPLRPIRLHANKKGSRPTKPARASQRGREPSHTSTNCTDPCVQRPSRALLGPRQHSSGTLPQGETKTVRHHGDETTRVTRMSSYGKRRTSRVLRRADLAAENRGRAPLTQTCPADLACMPSKRGKARHTTQTGDTPREAGPRRETRRLCAPAPYWGSYSDRHDFQEEFANDF
jgi:hypothetical protein